MTQREIEREARKWAVEAAEHNDYLTATIAEIAAGMRPAGQTLYGYYSRSDARECVAEWEADRKAQAFEQDIDDR